MGHGILTGQVAPPPERYSLREDMCAWVAAIRGLRDNPLVTHLHLAEQRRLGRIPRWRRNLPVVIVALGLLLLAISLLLGTWLPAIDLRGHLWEVLVTAVPVVVIVLFAVWFLQGVFQAVVAAFGVLGRYHKRPSHLCLDDFACLSSLTEHEIVAGAAAVLLPPLFWRVVALAMGLLITPGYLWLMSFPYHVAEDNYFYAGVFACLALLAVQLVVTGTLGSLNLVLYFMCLGRGLKVEGFAALAAGGMALAQAAYPLLLLTGCVGAGQGYLMAGQAHSWTLSNPPGRETALYLLCFLLILPATLALLGLALGMARRSPSARISLALATPLLWWVGGYVAALLMYPPAQLALGELELFEEFVPAMSLALLQGAGGLALLAPAFVVDPALFMHDARGYPSAGSDPALGLAWLVLAARLLVFLLLQAGMLYILARFAREAVRARRCRGD